MLRSKEKKRRFVSGVAAITREERESGRGKRGAVCNVERILSFHFIEISLIEVRPGNSLNMGKRGKLGIIRIILHFTVASQLYKMGKKAI